MINKIKDKYSKHQRFVDYSLVGGVNVVLNIFLLWLFIDIFKIHTVISSTIVVGGIFVIKYFVYKKRVFAK